MSRAAGWVLLAAVLVFARLNYLPALDPDEAHYAQITREMVASGNWMVPTIDGVPFIDKPVMFHWLQGLAFVAFGEHEWSARLPPALGAIALLWTTFWFGRTLFGARVGERAALILALMPLSFILAHVAIFDMVFTACLFGSFACFVTAALRRATDATDAGPKPVGATSIPLLVAGVVLLAMAVQIKGPVAGLLMVLAIAAAALPKGTRAVLTRVPWLVVIPAAGLLALPWFVWSWVHFGRQFFDAYIMVGNLQLWAAPIYRARFNPFFYVGVFVMGLFPWAFLVLGRLADLTRLGRWRSLDPRETLLWVWTAVIFVFFSASRFKLDTYIFPLVPAICLLAARAWDDAAGDAASARITRAFRFVMAASLVAIGVLGAVALVETDLRASPWAFVIPAAAAVAGVWWGIGLFRGGAGQMRRLVAPLVAVYLGVVLFAFPAYARARPAARLGQWVASSVEPAGRVAQYNQFRWEASFRFYSKRPVVKFQVEKDLVAAWRDPTARLYCLMLDGDVEMLKGKGLEVFIAAEEPGVVGTSGRGFRQQVWGRIVVATNRAAPVR